MKEKELTRAQHKARQIVGNNILRLRTARDWSRTRLAEKTGYSGDWLRGVERATMNSSVDRLAHIAKILGVELYVLFVEP